MDIWGPSPNKERIKYFIDASEMMYHAHMMYETHMMYENQKEDPIYFIL